MLGGDAGSDEDWVVLSSHEATASPKSRILPEASRDAYIDFQLGTRFGTFSFLARPIRRHVRVPEVDAEKPVHPQEQSLLFRLPVEIRLEIYEHLFRIPASDSASKILRRQAVSRTSTALTILLTCRRALAEAEGIFYSINRLCLEQPNEFLSSLGARRRSAITKFSLVVGSAASTLPRLEQLHSLPNLTSLHIERKASGKYQDVSSWAVMAPQLIAEIRKMQKLAEVKILMPEARGCTEHDIDRMNKMDEIDRRLASAISG